MSKGVLISPLSQLAASRARVMSVFWRDGRKRVTSSPRPGSAIGHSLSLSLALCRIPEDYFRAQTVRRDVLSERNVTFEDRNKSGGNN